MRLSFSKCLQNRALLSEIQIEKQPKIYDNVINKDFDFFNQVKFGDSAVIQHCSVSINRIVLTSAIILDIFASENTTLYMTFAACINPQWRDAKNSVIVNCQFAYMTSKSFSVTRC